MKKAILLLILLPSLAAGQYWDERVAEKSFETSERYFQTYYLNPYGLHLFGDAALGLVDDPFLRLNLNPANLPKLENGNFLFYVDFRGDRTEEPIIENYYNYNALLDYAYIRPDPRWYSVAREEPQPVFSLGILTYPWGQGRTRPYLGGSYQMIYKQERFYTMPTWIYLNRFGYDSFGREVFDAPIVPVEDRYLGKDELLTEAHLATFYAGLSPSDRIDLGAALSLVTHSRDGGYINQYSDQYLGSYEYEWYHRHEEARNQDYDHVDLAGGLRYHFNDVTAGGVKVGYLSGEADQSYLSLDSSNYNYEMTSDPDNWSHSLYLSRTDQAWNRKGKSWYSRLGLDHDAGRGRLVSINYQYLHTNIDLTNKSIIRDTSDYRSRYAYDTSVYDYSGYSYTRDDRQGSGESRSRQHDLSVSLKWPLNFGHTVYAGGFFSRRTTTTTSDEPVTADRWSEYESLINDMPRYSSYYGQYEQKVLVWDYETTYWTLQIPILLDLRLTDFLGMRLGVNRILENWKTKDVTTAYFIVREQNNNGTITREEYFGERYTMPEEKMTDDHTVVITSLEAKVSPQYTIRLLLNPELEDNFRIAEWWLSFEFRP